MFLAVFVLMFLLRFDVIIAESFYFNGEQYIVTKDNTISVSKYSYDIVSETLATCALMCTLQAKCCGCSFSVKTSTCRLEKSDNCCLRTSTAIGWSILRRHTSYTSTCTECDHYGVSMYAIIELAATWNEAVSNCTCLGGHLAEIETSGEIDFITNELSIRPNRGIGYWLGGYNFNADSDHEWISKPTDIMPFTNWYAGEPNLQLDENCLIAFRWNDFKWNDLNCALSAPYICEF